MKVCFYIDGHGFGHATRSVAVVRALRRAMPGTEFFIRSEGNTEFLSKSLPFAKVSRMERDIGIAYDEKTENFEVDVRKTLRGFVAWVGGWPETVDSELAFCRRNCIDLILSDIMPEPFLFAEELCVPAVAISNFAWSWVFGELFGEIDEVRALHDAYARAEAILALPFEEGLKPFRKKIHVPLVSRRVGRSRREIRSSLGVGERDVLAFFSLGKYFGGRRLRLPERAKYLVPSVIKYKSAALARIPVGETETQDYVAVCGLALIKAGYSTVSECVRARVPMLLLCRRGFAEDELIAAEVERLGVGRRVEIGELGKWDEEEVAEMRRNYENISERYRKDGTREIIEYVSQFK